MKSDFLILADGAQVAGDKLFVLGGGWRFVHATQYPAQHPMAVACGILVDWEETNRRHDFRVAITNDDTGQVLFEGSGQFEQGRLPGIPPGITQRVMLAFSLALSLERSGTYMTRLYLNSEVAAEQPFTAMPASSGRPS